MERACRRGDGARPGMAATPVALPDAVCMQEMAQHHGIARVPGSLLAGADETLMLPALNQGERGAVGGIS